MCSLSISGFSIFIQVLLMFTNVITIATHALAIITNGLSRLLQMLVGSGRFVVGFAVPTERLSCVMYQYIAENYR